MEIIITKNYDEMSLKAYELIKKIISKKKNAILGLATGSTPIGLYKFMVEGYEKGEISYKDIKTFNLDEYAGLGEGDEQSYKEFMKKNLFNHIDIKSENTHLPDGKDKNLKKACEKYNKMLEENEIDVQILGIGGNGHIAFNEPNTPFDSVTQIINLTEKTISDNARFFEKKEDVPTKAISMGIKNILNAKSIILLASGEGKADAIKRAIKGEITEELPASVLQRHNNITFIIDEAAASKL